ncbi:hypothetical protein [Tabrizicola sp.]|uniref:hypothetical protein n=1 Tax=Tabrizicola sp. TaxID=2005166 RepID=UPI002FDE0A9F
MTKFYAVGNEGRAALAEAISKAPLGQGPFASSYPLLLDEQALGEAGLDPELVQIVRNAEGVGAVFASCVNLTTRETISTAQLDEHSALRTQFDEIVGLRYRPVQLFAVVWVHSRHNVVEVRTDFPRGMTQELAHQLQSQYRKAVNMLIGQDILVRPVDLYPLVWSMYSDASEGKVVQLTFNTSTGSVKDERMRRTRLCLREELYHVGGVNALSQDIQPFHVSIQWHLSADGLLLAPELTLAGTSRGAHKVGGGSGEPVISAALIKDCLGTEDYEYVSERVLEHLRRLTPAEPAAATAVG